MAELKNMENKNSFWKNREILPSITTTSKANWRKQIEELKKIELKEVAVFPTCLRKKERKEFYELLKETAIKRIPIVHLRKDMELWELDYLVKNYKTEVFNMHTQAEIPSTYDYSKYKNITYIENTYASYNEKEIRKFGGICLDLAHLENDRILAKEKFEHDIKIIEKCSIGCNHISVLKKVTLIDGAGEVRYDNHFLEDFSELDYLKKYPSAYFSPFIAIELENSITEQLEAKKYIIDLLKDI